MCLNLSKPSDEQQPQYFTFGADQESTLAGKRHQ
jgi:hypothetical protein